MIDRCFNPHCRRKLHYLRDGRVVRVITGKASQLFEHYWLCGPCCEEFNFVIPPDGKVRLEARSKIEYSNEFDLGEATLTRARIQ